MSTLDTALPLTPSGPFIVVSGLPASGKSTLARKLSTRTHVEVLDKDELLEQFFLGNSDIDDAQRDRLSRDADDMLRDFAHRARAAFVVSHWRREQNSMTSGTATSWLHELPKVIELHCSCEPSIALERFTDRRRHAGHGDERRNRQDLLAQFQQLAELGPIGIAPGLTVDTSGDVDLEAVVVSLQRFVQFQELGKLSAM